MSIKATWHNFITSGINIPHEQGDHRLLFINIFSLVGFVLELSFGTINISNNNFLIGIVEILTACALMANLLLLRRIRDTNLAARILIAIIAAPLMIMLFTATGSSTGIFWLPALPVAAYLLLGKHQGSTALLILFLTIGLLSLLETFELVQLAYSFISVRQLILSLLVLTVILYVHENLKEQSEHRTKQKTQALTSAYKSIRHTEELRDEFTSALAHELRNAFVGIQKLTETWRDQRDKISRERSSEYVQLIHQSATDNLALVNSLLDIVNVDTPGFKVTRGFYSLQEVIDQQVTLFKSQADSANLKIVKVIDSEIPWQLYMDSFRIKQVLANLLSNAMKHSTAGETITVQVIAAIDNDDLIEKGHQLNMEWYLSKDEPKLRQIKDFVFIGVSHPEKGLSKGEIRKLFKKFSRLQVRDDLHHPSGHGLGLYIIKRIIDTHGGTYGVASKANQGVTFYITLPATTDKQPSTDKTSKST